MSDNSIEVGSTLVDQNLLDCHTSLTLATTMMSFCEHSKKNRACCQ